MRLTSARQRYLEHIARQDQAALFAEHANGRTQCLNDLMFYGMITWDLKKPTGRVLTPDGKQLLASCGDREYAQPFAALETA